MDPVTPLRIRSPKESRDPPPSKNRLYRRKCLWLVNLWFTSSILAVVNLTAWYLMKDYSKLVISLSCFAISFISMCCLAEETDFMCQSFTEKEVPAAPPYSTTIYDDV